MTSEFPSWIAPQLSKLVEQVPSGDEWAHEIKLDGYRMLPEPARAPLQGLAFALVRAAQTRSLTWVLVLAMAALEAMAAMAASRPPLAAPRTPKS